MTLLKLTLITLLSTLIYAAEPGQKDNVQEKAQKPVGIHYGTILEIKDVKEYKYLKVDEGGKEVWIAILNVPVKVGDKIGYDKKTPMHNFKSSTLDQTFKEIFFSSDLYLPENVQKPQSMKEMLGLSPEEQKKATGSFVKKDAYTVEEIHKWRKDLEGQIISVKGSIQKVSREILKLDWVHINDGTGNEKALTNDLVFTAANTNIKPGDDVLAKGKVVINKDFGFGYFYRVIIQDATFQVK